MQRLYSDDWHSSFNVNRNKDVELDTKQVFCCSDLLQTN